MPTLNLKVATLPWLRLCFGAMVLGHEARGDYWVWALLLQDSGAAATKKRSRNDSTKSSGSKTNFHLGAYLNPKKLPFSGRLIQGNSNKEASKCRFLGVQVGHSTPMSENNELQFTLLSRSPNPHLWDYAWARME